MQRIKTTCLHKAVGDHLQPRVDDVDNAQSLQNCTTDHPQLTIARLDIGQMSLIEADVEKLVATVALGMWARALSINPLIVMPASLAIPTTTLTAHQSNGLGWPLRPQ